MRSIHLLLFSPIMIGVAHGAVIAAANFSGMSATDATTVARVENANDFSWSLFDNNTGVNLDIVTDDDSPGIGGGNALQMDILTTSTFKGMLGTMASATTISIGETLTLSLDGRYAQTPGNNGGGLRIGFTTAAARDNAFFAQLGTGGSTGYSLLRDEGGDNSPGAGTVFGLASAASGSAYVTTGTEAFNMIFSITRSGENEYEIVSNINGAIRTATSNVGFNSYDSIFIRNGGISSDLRLDNISVTLIPEPAVALLGAFGLLCLLRRRRL